MDKIILGIAVITALIYLYRLTGRTRDRFRTGLTETLEKR